MGSEREAARGAVPSAPFSIGDEASEEDEGSELIVTALPVLAVVPGFTIAAADEAALAPIVCAVAEAVDEGIRTSLVAVRGGFSPRAETRRSLPLAPRPRADSVTPAEGVVADTLPLPTAPTPPRIDPLVVPAREAVGCVPVPRRGPLLRLLAELRLPAEAVVAVVAVAVVARTASTKSWARPRSRLP